MAELSAILLDAVQAFAQGAPQEDDMTVVLVKREARRGDVADRFRRSFDSLEDDLRVHRGVLRRRHGVDPSLLPTVDLVVEELFTNMVKYSPDGRRRRAHRHGRGRRVASK